MHPRVPYRSSSIYAKVSEARQWVPRLFSTLVIDKTPLERAEILETTPLFANIHADAASGGQSAVPTDLDTDLHFTCFVQAPSPPAREDGTPATPDQMRVLELDGRRAGPVDRGECKDFLQVRFPRRGSTARN